MLRKTTPLFITIARSLALSFFLLFFAISSAIAQPRWQEHYNPGQYDEVGRGLVVTPDFGYIVCGKLDFFGGLTKLDLNGNVQWSSSYTFAASFSDIINTIDGNYVATFEGATMGLAKVDVSGNLLWSTPLDFQGGSLETTSNPLALSDGTFLTTGTYDDGANYLSRVIKFDAMGDTMWTKPLGAIGNEVFSIQPNNNNQFLIVSNGNGNFQYTVIDQLGNVDNQGIIPSSFSSLAFGTVNYGNIMLKPNGGGFTLCNTTFNQEVQLIHLNDQGLEQWATIVTTNGYGESVAMVETPGGGFVIAAQSLGGDKIVMLNTSSSGQLLGSIEYDFYPGSGVEDRAYNIIKNALGGFTLVGSGEYITNNVNMLVMSMDTLANIYPNRVSGNVFDDVNDNCVKDAGEQGLETWVVELTDGINHLYGVPDSNGDYEIYSFPGTYNLIVHRPVPSYWAPASCSSDTVSIVMPGQSVSGAVNQLYHDFPRIKTINCPMIYLDLSGGLMRRCFPNTYQLQYCNYGTEDEPNASIEVALDPAFTLDSASYPYTINANGNLEFAIGNLPIDSCGNISIYTFLHCDSSINDQFHCMAAWATPDSSCLPQLPAWDGSEIDLSLTCLGDSVQLRVENIGLGDMSAASSYYVVEDDIMIINNTFQLLAGEALELTIPSNGQTWFARANQLPGYTGYQIPTAVLEGCGTDVNGNFSMQYALHYPMDVLAPWHAKDCQETRSSCDPNDKRAIPEGYGAANYIDQNTRIDYHVRFQNTGNDTAFNVVIRDTLSEYVNPATLVSGVSSDPYTFRIYDGRIAEWTFSNIYLPDSTTDVQGSQGFVKFQIQQQPNNPIGTVIENRADIYFDFNAPVITNTAFNTIGSNFITGTIETISASVNNINLSPNPLNSTSMLCVETRRTGNLTVIIYDAVGKQVKELQSANSCIPLNAEDYSGGLYLFQVHQNGEVIGTGKFIVR